MVLLLLSSFSFSGCGKRASDTNDSQDIVTYHQQGDLVTIRGQMEFNLKGATLKPFIQMKTKEDTIKSLPHIYFNNIEQSIIHITEETTIVTTIENIDSPNYEVGYIVERNAENRSTNAPYSIDLEQSRLYPIHPDHSFFVITLHLHNKTNQDLLPDDLEIFIEWDENNQKKVDFLLSETIFIDAPHLLEPKSSSIFRCIAVVPSDVSSLIVEINGKKIEWQKPSL